MTDSDEINDVIDQLSKTTAWPREELTTAAEYYPNPDFLRFLAQGVRYGARLSRNYLEAIYMAYQTPQGIARSSDG